jgi:hypothetical protein
MPELVVGVKPPDGDALTGAARRTPLEAGGVMIRTGGCAARLVSGFRSQR